MSIQFGMADMMLGGNKIGCLQNITMDFSFDSAELFCGKNIYAKDVRVHTGHITGNAEFADLTAAAIQKMIGGTLNYDSISLANSDSPGSFQLVTTLTTDGVTFKITFNKVRSTKLSLPYVRDNHLIPNFDFSCYQDATGSIATIDVGDVS